MSRRSYLVRGVSTLAVVLSAGPALAQQPVAAVQAQEPLTEDGGEREDIVVTGSRIKGDPNRTSPSPIVSVTAEDIRTSGEGNVSEVLRELPALINSIPTSNSFETNGFSTPGLATLNLRGLGSNRTLVLVNGQRHVSGALGQQAVDVASIPSALIDRVDVLTGGASSIYGADAVSGVVNFVLKRKYEGIDVRSQIGISEEGDGRTVLTEGIWGKNFAGGRGNVVIAGAYDRVEEIFERDRDFTRDNARAFPLNNPERYFQRNEISSSGTPNFLQFFGIQFGPRIPASAEAFIADFRTKFPDRPAPTLTQAELALISRAQNAPPSALIFNPRGTFASDQGLISRADNRPFTTDLNGNGIPDCRESFTGLTSGRCYVTAPGGGVRIFQDGTLFSNVQSGGDGAPFQLNSRSLTPGVERFNVNLLGRFEFSPAAELFGEAKFVRNTIVAHEPYYAFTAFLLLKPDNPFIPVPLRADAQAAGGLSLFRDINSDLGEDEAIRIRRDTHRGVLGLRGQLSERLRYEIAGVYGTTKVRDTRPRAFADRFFASLDVVQGPNGQPICRSNIDKTTLPPGDPFNGRPGFVTFNPGDGSCVPVNPFNGRNAFSGAAADWILGEVTDRYRLEQQVLTGQLAGDTEGFINLPGGPIRFAAGAEYRKEKSSTDYDPLTQGLLPVTSPAGPAGSPTPTSFFFASSPSPNQSGSFNVKEVFGEVEVPLLVDRPFFHDLRIGGAARYSDYGGGAARVGNTFTWSANAVFAPVRDLRFRATYSKAIRAPNIGELFEPVADTLFFQITDPCAADQIALLPANDPRRANRVANCAAAGIPANFVEETIATKGQFGGNPNLREETAKTFTLGAVLQPRFIPGLTLSADYYDIRLESAIGGFPAQTIVNGCYDASSLDNPLCQQLTRDTNPASSSFRNINFIRSSQVNFGRLETAGVDATIAYNFALGENRFALRGTVNWVDRIDNYFDPTAPNAVNRQLKEAGYPEWSGVGSATYSRGPVSLTYRLQYIGEVAHRFVAIEDVVSRFGPNGGFEEEKFIHDLSASINVNSQFSFYGGVNNFTNEKPYSTDISYPVSGVGRFFYVGVRGSF